MVAQKARRTDLRGLRSVGYFRVSTEMQHERGVSLDVQRERYDGFVRQHGLVSVGTYVDVASGARSDREQYIKLLDACRAGQVDAVVVMFLDRFGRDMPETLSRWWELERLGIQIHATDESLESGEELPSIIKVWMASQERRRIGERSRAGRLKRAQQGALWLSPVPYGWRKETAIENGQPVRRLVLSEPEAAVVRLCARWLLDGLSMRQIAIRLREQGFRTPCGSPFAMARVWTLLTRPHNVGDAVWAAGLPDEVRMPGILPPIYDRETDARVREILAVRSVIAPRAATSPHLLTGILRCGDCAAPMSARHGGRLRRSVGYMCTGHARNGSCANSWVSMKALDGAVLQKLSGYSDAEIAAQLAPAPNADGDAAAELDAARGRLAEVERQLLRDHRLFREGVLDEAQFSQVTADLRERRVAAEQRIAALEREQEEAERRQAKIAALPRQIRSFAEDFPALSPELRKQRLQHLVQRVSYPKSGAFTITLRA